MTWEHDDLARDLASHLSVPSRMVWTDMQLGPQGSPRPDVFTMEKSFVRPKPTAYEVKTSAPDFRSDTTSGKWGTYLEYAGAVYFCVPAGLVKKEDVPVGCGLIVRHENVWRTAKRATVNPATLPGSLAFMKLVIDGCEREHRNRNFIKRFNTHQANKTIRDKFGKYVAEAANDLQACEARILRLLENADARGEAIIQQARSDAERIDSTTTEMKKELLEALGLEDGHHSYMTVYSMIREVKILAASVQKDLALDRLVRDLNNIKRPIEAAIERYSHE